MTRRLSLDDDTAGNYFPSTAPIALFSSGCQLLDCALGGGWPEGRIVNIVGDKCLSGDTIVSARRGSSQARKMTLRTLFSRVRGSHPNRDVSSETYLVSDVGGYVGLQPVLDVVESGEKLLYEITNDRGQSIQASADHKFASRDGWKCLSTGLTVGMLIKCWRGSRGKPETSYQKKARNYTDSIPFHPFGHHHVIGGRDYKRLLTARLVLEAAINKLELEEFIYILRRDPASAAALQYTDPKYEMHHLDGDCTNDRLENLQLVNPEDHWSIHAGEMPPSTKAVDLSEVVSIRRVGREQTFDVTMAGPYHNFVANGFVVHNSTGKTLLAIEASANFAIRYPKGKIFYRETEAAFDEPYAQRLGLPLDRVDMLRGLETVEDVFEDMEAVIKKARGPALYILDSLDAVSDRAEQKRKIDDATYGGTKPKQLGQLFRRLTQKMNTAKVTFIIISQVRDNIGVMFGEKHTRTGGRALDFYASQIVWLAHLKQLNRTVNKIKRVVGVQVRAKVKKNKIGPPFREADFPILFSYGVDDVVAACDWFEENDIGTRELVASECQNWKEFRKWIKTLSDEEYAVERRRLARLVKREWDRVEETFSPKRSKY